MRIALEDVYTPSGDVVAREIEGEIIIVPLVAGSGDMEDELFTLNDTGKAIWDQLDGQRSLSRVVAAIETEFEGAATTSSTAAPEAAASTWDTTTSSASAAHCGTGRRPAICGTAPWPKPGTRSSRASATCVRRAPSSSRSAGAAASSTSASGARRTPAARRGAWTSGSSISAGEAPGD